MDKELARSETKVNNRPNNKFIKRTMVIIAIVIMVILFARGIVVKFMRQGVKSVTPQLLVYVDYRPVKAGLIMFEEVFVAEGKGILTVNAREGVRIPVGTEIASINLMADKSNAREQLLKVQSAINYKRQSAELSVTDDGEHMATNTERQLLERIQNAIADDNFYEVSMSMTNLDLTTRRSVDITDLGNLMDKSIEELEGIRAQLEREIGTSNKRYFASHGGIVTYELDGYEELLPAREFENYDYAYITSVKPKSVEKINQQQVEQGAKLFKLIDNFKWYLAVAFTDVDIWSTFEIGNRLNFSLDGKEIHGKLEMINVGESNGVAIVGFEQGLEGLYRNRFPDASLIYRKVRAHKLPVQTLVEKEGDKPGVYVKEINGIVKFKPVEVINRNEEYVFVNLGDTNGYLHFENEEPIKTVTMYDEVLINPSAIKEEQILE